MTGGVKTYIIKHTEDGLQLVRDRESDQAVSKDVLDDLPTLDTLVEPRWNHWYQRKLARPWQATLLGMNIEPVSNAWRILKVHDPVRYQIYRDRLDILQTLIGVEILFYDSHVREGEGANEKYIELTEYCEYATKLNWSDLEPMRSGLKLDQAPPTLNFSQRRVNNYLTMLDTIFQNWIGDYFNAKEDRSPAAVMKWFAEKDVKCPIEEPTLVQHPFCKFPELVFG